MLKSVLVPLQGEALTRVNPKPLDEVPVAIGEGFVPAPGTMNALHRQLLAGLGARSSHGFNEILHMLTVAEQRPEARTDRRQLGRADSLHQAL